MRFGRVDQPQARQDAREQHLDIAPHRRLAQLPRALLPQALQAHFHVLRQLTQADNRALRAAALQQRRKVGKLSGRGDEHQPVRILRIGIGVNRTGKAQAYVSRPERVRFPVHQHPRAARKKAGQLELRVQVLGKAGRKARRQAQATGQVFEIRPHRTSPPVQFLSAETTLLSYIIARGVL